MGLDVYLYKRLPGTPITPPEHGEEDEEIDDDFNAGERIELDSKAHPDHLFKIGYFRSSYNDGGIDNKLRARLGVDLADLVGTTGSDYYVIPDWPAARERTTKVIASAPPR